MKKEPHNFRFVSADVKTWKKLADMAGLNLTEWITRKCNGVDRSVLERGTIGTAKPETVRRVEPVDLAERRVSEPGRSAAPAGKCPHHHERGELCYKCDGKFGVPMIEGEE